MSSGRRSPGGLEQEVIATLAAADEPMTPAAVRDGLDKELAYTTVMTVLARLHEKGVVRRERAGRAYSYAVIRDTAEITARQMQRLLHTRDDRAAVLARFVGTLSEDDERLLATLLRQAGREEEP